MPSPLLERARHLGPEFTRFIVVGGFCFLLDFTLFNVFHFGLDLGPLTSKSLATIIATAVSYVGNRMWSFSHRVEQDRNQGQDIGVYAGINVLGLILTLIPLAFVYYALGTRDHVAVNVAQVFGTGVATLFRFWAYRRWVFTSEPELAKTAALV